MLFRLLFDPDLEVGVAHRILAPVDRAQLGLYLQQVLQLGALFVGGLLEVPDWRLFYVPESDDAAGFACGIPAHGVRVVRVITVLEVEIEFAQLHELFCLLLQVVVVISQQPNHPAVLLKHLQFLILQVVAFFHYVRTFLRRASRADLMHVFVGVRFSI